MYAALMMIITMMVMMAGDDDDDKKCPIEDYNWPIIVDANNAVSESELSYHTSLCQVRECHKYCAMSLTKRSWIVKCVLCCFQAFSGYYGVIHDFNLTSSASLDELEAAARNICSKTWNEVSDATVYTYIC